MHFKLNVWDTVEFNKKLLLEMNENEWKLSRQHLWRP